MKQISPQRLFVAEPIPCGLWSLWDMLNCWGYLYYSTGVALAYAVTALLEQRTKTGGAIPGHGTSILDPDDEAALLVASKCAEILHFMKGYEDELGTLPMQIGVLQAKLKVSREKRHQLPMYTNDILDDVMNIKDGFTMLLSQTKFYYLAPTMAQFYGKTALFGEEFWEKFRNARDDLVQCTERAPIRPKRQSKCWMR